jgi:hypothetical protein
VPGDQLRADTGVGGREDPADLGQRYVEFPQPVDHLRGRDLRGRVVPVPAERIDRGRLQQPAVVVPTKRAHAQMGELRELADRQPALHPATVHPPPGRESTS